MNRWLKKIRNAPNSELTQLTKEGFVSSVSAPTGAFEEKSVSGNRWLARLNMAPRHLEEVPPAPTPTVAEDSPLASMTMPTSTAPKGAPAPLQEVERIIEVLTREVGRDLGPDLENLMRRVMGPLDRGTRATLAAEIDDAFEAAQGIESAREQAAQAIRGKVGDPPPTTLDDWLAWIEARCPINADDRKHLASRLRWLPPAKLATACRWYAQTWAKVAAAEPRPARQENAARRAANQALLAPQATPLPQAARHPQRRQAPSAPPQLPSGMRMSWTLRVDGKRLTMAGKRMTREQAQCAAEARWPGAAVEVLPHG